MRKTLYGFFGVIILLFASCNQVVDSSRLPNSEDQTIVSDEYFISESDAEAIAESFLDGDFALLGSDSSDALRSSGSSNLPSYYIFTRAEGGYVIVSATESAYPILGYSEVGSIDLNNLPDGLKYILGLYSADIQSARKGNVAPSEKVKHLRNMLGLRAADPVGTIVVEPLLGNIAWNQSPFYNALTPNPSVPIGCVATATSQILRYWKYPDKAVGHHSYESPMFGTISFDFNHTFDWDNMPEEELTEPNQDIAILCYAVAVGVNMNFNYGFNGGSGAVHSDVPPALYRHFGYPKNITAIRRADFEDEAWLSIMKNELDNKRPIQYGGTGSGGGHSFVLDGYDDADYFHVNWGWGGMSNGWFQINALDPDDLGTGGGSGGFNKNQDMIVNFAPPARVLGDNNDPIIDDSEEEGGQSVYDNGVEYENVITFNVLDLFIRYTNFGGMVTTSDATGYSAYFNKCVSVAAGSELSYQVEYVINTNDAITPELYIYIDLNDDGQFDAAEKINTTLNSADAIVKGNYLVPADAAKGLHRMRVLISNGFMKDPNKIMITGEFEDYYVNIK